MSTLTSLAIVPSLANPGRDALASPSTSGTPSMPTFTPSLTFAEVPSMSTCGNATISWNYTGPGQELSLFVSNDTATPPLLLPLIAPSLAATAGAYFWQPVNVTPGVYEIVAVGADISSISASFRVSSGRSSSCLPTSLSFPATTIHFPTVTPAAVSQEQPNSDKPSRTGAIVGGIAGGIVFIAALIGICIYIALRRKATPGYRWRSFTTTGRAGRLARWSGLSSHVDISAQNPPSSPLDETTTAVVPDVRDFTPLTIFPRLEPNRRKPSISLSALPAAEIPSPTHTTQHTAPAVPALLLDKELPHRPTSYAASVDRPRRSRTFDTTDAASVIWLRRHSSLASPTRRPSGASAVPSSATSQMYRVRDSMWTASFGALGPRDRASPDGWSVYRGAQYPTRTKSMGEVTGDAPPLPSGDGDA